MPYVGDQSQLRFDFDPVESIFVFSLRAEPLVLSIGIKQFLHTGYLDTLQGSNISQW